MVKHVFIIHVSPSQFILECKTNVDTCHGVARVLSHIATLSMDQQCPPKCNENVREFVVYVEGVLKSSKFTPTSGCHHAFLGQLSHIFQGPAVVFLV